MIQANSPPAPLEKPKHVFGGGADDGDVFDVGVLFENGVRGFGFFEGGGDAACAAGPGGNGTGNAVVAACVLAGELARAGDSYHTAFARYEQLLRPYVAKGQKQAKGGAAFLAPPTEKNWENIVSAQNRPRPQPVPRDQVAIVDGQVIGAGGGAGRGGGGTSPAPDITVVWRKMRGPGSVEVSPARVPLVTHGDPNAVVEFQEENRVREPSRMHLRNPEEPCGGNA